MSHKHVSLQTAVSRHVNQSLRPSETELVVVNGAVRFISKFTKLIITFFKKTMFSLSYQKAKVQFYFICSTVTFVFIVIQYLTSLLKRLFLWTSIDKHVLCSANTSNSWSVSMFCCCPFFSQLSKEVAGMNMNFPLQVITQKTLIL